MVIVQSTNTASNSVIMPIVSGTSSTTVSTNQAFPVVVVGGSTTSSVWYGTTFSDVMNDNVDDILKILKGKGISLGNGSTLKIKNNIPYLEYTNNDNKTSSGIKGIRGVIDFTDKEYTISPGTVFRTPDGTCFEIEKDGSISQDVLLNTNKKFIDVSGGRHCLLESISFNHFKQIAIPDGSISFMTMTLPDGTVLTLKPDDSVSIDDSNAKILYRSSPVRNFNKYLNASDLLEEFVKYCAQEKITKNDFQNLPISLFIYWLIVEATKADRDDLDDVAPMLESAVKNHKSHTHKCKQCGKFLSKKYESNGINFCSSQHMSLYLEKIA